MSLSLDMPDPAAAQPSALQSHPSPDLSSRQSPQCVAADLATLAAALQQIAQSLLALAPRGPEKSAVPECAAAPASPTRLPPEIRTYSLADYLVKEEKALLDEYHAEDWQELLHMARSRFETLYTLMRHFHEEEEISGFLLQQIAEDLMAEPLALLSRLCSLVEDFRAPEEEES